MTPYQLMVEGVFVGVGGSTKNGGYGFHGTFYVMANGAENAVRRACDLIAIRMKAHGVSEISVGVFRTYYYVHDIWEIAETMFQDNCDVDSGFTFFRVGPIERVKLAFRHFVLKRTKPWRLVEVRATSRMA